MSVTISGGVPLRSTIGFVVLIALGMGITVGSAADDQAYLGIFAETSLTVMPSMAGMPGMADMLKDLPKGVELPPGMAAMFEGAKPERKLDIRLWSPGVAPQDATAWIAPPAGLKVGKRLDLELYRPTAAESDDMAMPPGMPKFEEMTIKIYWGSSPTVKPDQPRIIKVGDMPAEQKAEMQAQAKAAMAQGGYFYKPDWTTAHWPTEKQPGVIADDASLVGDYALTTNYTGNVTIGAPAAVNFLAPFALSSPDTAQAPDLTKAIPFQWTAIPNALGIHAGITGMEGRNTIVIWTSSESMPEGWTMPDMGYLQMAEVQQYVRAEIMMPGAATEVTVPAGIFAKCMMPMLAMVGYGPGAALPQGQPLPRIQTKTTLSMNLGDMAKAAGGMMPPGQ